LYYANEQSDGVIGGSTETAEHSTNIEAAFFKLGTSNVHHKRNNDSHRAVAMTAVMPLVLF